MPAAPVLVSIFVIVFIVQVLFLIFLEVTTQSVIGDIHQEAHARLTLHCHSLAYLQAPFPIVVHPSKIHRLSQAMSSMGNPLASSTQGCTFLKQPGWQGRHLESVPHAHIALVGMYGLYS